METDIPLRRLTMLRGADLLPLLGYPNATLIRAESLNMPSLERRLDNALYVRSPGGQEHLHMLEWQGYIDRAILPRLAFYVAWAANENPHITVLGTVIYLHPAYDRGHILRQMVDGQVVQQWQFACVRLWEHDARAAVASGNLGLGVLCPLMQGADSTLVEQVAVQIIHDTLAQEQSQLLTILGILSAEIVETESFIRFVGKERLMASDLIQYLWQDREQQWKQREQELLQREQTTRQELLQREQTTRQELQQTLHTALAQRFPDLPYTIIQEVQQITRLDYLHRLILALFQVSSLEEFRQVLHQTIGNGTDNGEAQGE